VNTAGSNWSEKDGKLFRRFEFDDFKSALSFVNKVGEIAEFANHHPDISFGWGYVEITLFTHSESAITDKDISLANKIDQL
jgi:4a-hydroxytetrahydrobiopterin dehydratase